MTEQPPAMEPTEVMQRPARNPPGTLDAQGRLLCTGSRSRGRGACNGPAIIGFDKCRIHVGKTVEQCRVEVDEALAFLAARAVGVLAEVLADPNAPVLVRARVAQDLLDRRGHRAPQRVDVTRTDLSTPEARIAASTELADEVARKRAEHEAREAG